MAAHAHFGGINGGGMKGLRGDAYMRDRFEPGIDLLRFGSGRAQVNELAQDGGQRLGRRSGDLNLRLGGAPAQAAKPELEGIRKLPPPSTTTSKARSSRPESRSWPSSRTRRLCTEAAGRAWSGTRFGQPQREAFGGATRFQ